MSLQAAHAVGMQPRGVLQAHIFPPAAYLVPVIEQKDLSCRSRGGDSVLEVADAFGCALALLPEQLCQRDTSPENSHPTSRAYPVSKLGSSQAG